MRQNTEAADNQKALVDSLMFEPLLAATEAARLLNLHPVTVLRWAREAHIPHHRMGRKVAFRASELNSWLGLNYTDDAVRVAQPVKGEGA
jgi:excisionase family DNA binding protein